jgi:hypothetical protein
MEYATKATGSVSRPAPLVGVTTQERRDDSTLSQRESEPKAKKQKVAIACDFCRAKKVGVQLIQPHAVETNALRTNAMVFSLVCQASLRLLACRSFTQQK